LICSHGVSRSTEQGVPLSAENVLETHPTWYHRPDTTGLLAVGWISGRDGGDRGFGQVARRNEKGTRVAASPFYSYGSGEWISRW